MVGKLVCLAAAVVMAQGVAAESYDVIVAAAAGVPFEMGHGAVSPLTP